ncbi:hypothetical protein K466DRAFT_602550 [Polyporus arcularius HHB13444]|uniref:Uncharacterized protein n=1 Tax=Polyporus arcularius HHB13444 TaxID=1314778 RepID=A0A5C3PD65_9APHY|nr:hypothetical protein K466DRAFT_602550 [Polyporus arcularius HHB13444]
MGRRAKYLTAQARQAAAREYTQRYAQSARGKATRATRNAQTYTQRRESRLQILALDMPEDLFRYARPLLRASFAFEPVPELSLGLWSAPYTIALPDASIRPSLHSGDGVWASPEARLSFFHYAQLMDEGMARAELWRGEDLDMAAVEAEIKDEIIARRDAWVAARNGVVGTLDAYVHDVYLHWGARIIVMLGEELELRKRGVEAYVAGRSQRRLPWQIMRASMFAMLSQ